MKEKKRLDQLVLDKYPKYSRTQVQSFIMQNKVKVDNKPVTKPGMLFDINSDINLSVSELKYISRAGYKLEKALTHFGVNVKDKVILDAGISTGGFTDCLFQQGAKKVYGIDVGYGQVHERVSNNPNLVLMERTNLRHLKNFPEKVDLVTLDLSFISVLKVMEVVSSILKDQGELIVLIKPQFESKPHEVSHKGIIKDPKVHDRVILEVTKGIEMYGFKLIGITDSPIEGATGNKEFLAYFKKVS